MSDAPLNPAASTLIYLAEKHWTEIQWDDAVCEAINEAEADAMAYRMGCDAEETKRQVINYAWDRQAKLRKH